MVWLRETNRSFSETVEQREERLRVQRERDRTRRAAWSKEERESALLRMRAYGSRVASKTVYNRQARLQGLRRNQRERLAAEPADERQARGACSGCVRTRGTAQNMRKHAYILRLKQMAYSQARPHNALQALVIL